MIAALTVTLDQPALVGDRARSDFLRSTHPYLPGGVVRGAFAAAWIARYGPPRTASAARRAEFVALFEGGVRFAPLFTHGPFVPLSVRRHKYQVSDRCARAEIDLAVEPGGPRHCGECGSDLEVRHGLPAAPQVQRRASVRLGPDGVAVRGNLFFRDTLTARQVFSGHLTSGDPGLLTRLAELGPVRLGGRRTTHGRASVAIDTTVATPTIAQRPDGRLILRLGGPAVFVDDQGRPIDRPNRAELREHLSTDFAIEQAWTRWEHHGGWHAASGLPKPGELTVAGGSTYLLRPTAPVSDQALIALAERGIGLRRHEGFGDLAAPYRPRRSPRELGEVALGYAPVLALTTNPRRWEPVLRMLTDLAEGNTEAADRLRRWAESITGGRPHPPGALVGGPPATAPTASPATGIDRATTTAVRNLLRLLEEPPEVLRWVVAGWQNPSGQPQPGSGESGRGESGRRSGR